MQTPVLPILVFVACTVALALVILGLGALLNPRRPGWVKRMPYESGMDPVHDTRRRFDVRFHLLAIAFLVFDVELLFLYPWAVVLKPAETATVQADHASAVSGPAGAPSSGPASAGALARPVFVGGMVFFVLLALGFVYDWRRGIFEWR